MFDVDIIFDGITVSGIDKSDILKIQHWMNSQRDVEVNFKDFFERFVEYYMSENEVFLKIERENKILGLLKGRIEFKNNNEFLIWYYIIDDKYRGKGIGSLILNSIQNYFIKEFNIKDFFAIVNEDNKQGLRFWNKNHFYLLRVAKDFFEKDHEMKDMFVLKRTSKA